MAKKTKDTSKLKLRSSYVSLVVSVSLVLFVLGILGLVLINAKTLSDYFRESLSFSIMFNDNAREADIMMLQKDLEAKEYVKKVDYISKDEAADKMQEELGEDFISFLGENPLPASLDVYLVSSYTSPDSVTKIESYINEYPFVQEVYYQESLLFLINDNIRKISFFLLILCALLFIISLTIINNAIRLSTYSKRFTIRTMQLVGATRSFIRRPFIKQSVVHGIIASMVALALVVGLIYLIEKELFLMLSSTNILLFILLGVAIIAIGILINIVSTYFAVNKYLSISDDNLYY